MSDQKIFVGGAKELSGNYGAFHKISFNHNDLNLLMENLNAKGYVNLDMNKRREPSQYGQTHSLTVDTWEPQPQGQAQQSQKYQQGQHPQHQRPVYTPPQHQQTPQQAFAQEQPMQTQTPENF